MTPSDYSDAIERVGDDVTDGYLDELTAAGAERRVADWERRTGPRARSAPERRSQAAETSATNARPTPTRRLTHHKLHSLQRADPRAECVMAKDNAMDFRNRAVKLFNAHKDEMSAGEKALLFATLAQVEATLEVVEHLEEGVTVRGDRKMYDGIITFQTSVDRLVRQLRRPIGER